MLNAYVLLALVLVGLGNVLPLVGVLSAARLQALYGVAIEDPVLLLLMRHRALLFGLLGGFVLASIAWPSWRVPALWLALLSMLGFVLLAGWDGQGSLAIRKVFWVDLFLILVAAGALALLQGRS